MAFEFQPWLPIALNGISETFVAFSFVDPWSIQEHMDQMWWKWIVPYMRLE